MRGAKLLVLGAIAMLVIAIVLWRQLQEGAATAAPAPAEPVAVAPPPPAAAPLAKKLVAAAEAAAPAQPGKLDPGSDEFFNHFTDQVPAIITSQAMRGCYVGGLHRRDRDQSITLDFVDHIKNGEVTVSNVKVRESNLNDSELESCMIAAVSKAHWHDDLLPDLDNEQDEVTINPERGGRKYMPENLRYVGAEAPANTPR